MCLLVLGCCGTRVKAVGSACFVFLFSFLLIRAKDRHVCALMLSGLRSCSSVVFLALWCALRCWWCLFLFLVTMFVFVFSFYPPPHSIHLPMPVYLMLGCWYFGLAPPQLSSSTLPPFSNPPAPSPTNGPPSPKFGRDPLSYCLKEINKTVKPRISSFRTLKRSVSHRRRSFGCQEPSTHQGSDTILFPCLCESDSFA